MRRAGGSLRPGMWLPKTRRDEWTQRILAGLLVAVVVSLAAGMCASLCG